MQDSAVAAFARTRVSDTPTVVSDTPPAFWRTRLPCALIPSRVLANAATSCALFRIPHPRSGERGYPASCCTITHGDIAQNGGKRFWCKERRTNGLGGRARTASSSIPMAAPHGVKGNPARLYICPPWLFVVHPADKTCMLRTYLGKTTDHAGRPSQVVLPESRPKRSS